MINNYERIILNNLLTKFERSKSFTGNNKVSQRFVLKVASLFPQYTDHSDFESFQGINEAIDVLQRKKLIFAKKNKANVCNEVLLNIEEIDRAYLYIGRKQKRDINNAVLNLLQKYKDKNSILNRFYTAQKNRIQKNKPIQFFSGDLKELESVLLSIDNLLKLQIETYARDFSVQVFNDSKVFERISGKVIGLLFEYGDFPEKNQVLGNLNIVKNPTYVNFKGSGVITISGQRLDLSALKSDIAISSAMLEDIEKIEITGDSVMTVENLTSFHSTVCDNNFLIYLGGFHNKIRREFIKKIYDQNPNLKFYHFGDIDAGGFHIFLHLKRLTRVNFIPYKMDLETLKQFQNKVKKLTENDKKRLRKLRGNEFDDVIEYMLEHNCKLEQEAVKLNNLN